MSAPTTRRRRHRGPDHTFLPSLAGIVDQATADDPDHVMVRVTGPIHPEVELGLRSLDPGSHPFDVLAGFEAPDDWAVFGLRTTGRARHLDDPTAAAAPGGEHVPRRSPRPRGVGAALRRRRRSSHPGPAEGTIPDLCRRVLGLPTAPAPRTTAALWAAMWLDRLIDRWGQPHRRRDLLSSWAQVAILHPAVPRAVATRPAHRRRPGVARRRRPTRTPPPPPGTTSATPPTRSRCPTVRSPPTSLAGWTTASSPGGRSARSRRSTAPPTSCGPSSANRWGASSSTRSCSCSTGGRDQPRAPAARSSAMRSSL